MTIFSAISGAAKTVGRVARQAKNTVGGNMPEPIRRATTAAVIAGRSSHSKFGARMRQRAWGTLAGKHKAPSQNQMTPENRMGKQFMRRQVRNDQIPESRQLMGFKEFLNEVSKEFLNESKKKYATRCPRCEGTGRHQGGRCFQCHGKGVIGQKSSKSEKLFRHKVKVGGKDQHIIAWGKDADDSWDVARTHLTNLHGPPIDNNKG